MRDGEPKTDTADLLYRQLLCGFPTPFGQACQKLLTDFEFLFQRSGYLVLNRRHHMFPLFLQLGVANTHIVSHYLQVPPLAGSVLRLSNGRVIVR